MRPVVHFDTTLLVGRRVGGWTEALLEDLSQLLTKRAHLDVQLPWNEASPGSTAVVVVFTDTADEVHPLLMLKMSRVAWTLAAVCAKVSLEAATPDKAPTFFIPAVGFTPKRPKGAAFRCALPPRIASFGKEHSADWYSLENTMPGDRSPQIAGLLIDRLSNCSLSNRKVPALAVSPADADAVAKYIGSKMVRLLRLFFKEEGGTFKFLEKPVRFVFASAPKDVAPAVTATKNRSEVLVWCPGGAVETLENMPHWTISAHAAIDGDGVVALLKFGKTQGIATSLLGEK